MAAAQMAVDDFGGQVLGKPISVIAGDHQLKPASAQPWRGAGTTSCSPRRRVLRGIG
jgi:hypothetical protein